MGVSLGGLLDINAVPNDWLWYIRHAWSSLSRLRDNYSQRSFHNVTQDPVFTTSDVYHSWRAASNIRPTTYLSAYAEIPMGIYDANVFVYGSFRLYRNPESKYKMASSDNRNSIFQSNIISKPRGKSIVIPTDPA